MNKFIKLIIFISVSIYIYFNTADVLLYNGLCILYPQIRFF